MHKFRFLLVLAVLLVDGCGGGGDKGKFSEEELAGMPFAQREGLPGPSGGFVLAVGGETITTEEIITEQLLEYFGPIAQRSSLEQFKEQAGPQLEQIVLANVSDTLLRQRAKRQAGDNIDERLEKIVDREVRKFVARFGNDYAKAEEALKARGMDWKDFRKHQGKMILSQSYIASQLPEQTAVTYGELVDSYNEMKEQVFVRPAEITFRLIDIEVSKLEAGDANPSRLEQAKELANELVREIDSGRDFGELARRYSHGHRASFGGLWKPVQPESLAEPYDVLAREAERMEVGEAAGPIDAGGHIFIMKLEEKTAKTFEPFEEVQKEVEATIHIERRKKALDELNRKLVQKAVASEPERFVDYCLEEIYRISNR
ncbi:MAG: peptidyl-prolyl cis-trans isomerase [Planctomycetota bacterium]|nr:MAG: peptidyl-prolyl cis-trans isomerase [Planctomycetota bacterium]